MEIDKEKFSLILSIIATVISTSLAILRFLDNRKKSKRKFTIEADVNEPFKYLELKVANKGYRPITIVGYEIYYGNEFTKQIIQTKKIEEPEKLLESDTCTIKIPKDEIVAQAKQRKVSQEYSCELWIKVIFSTKETPLKKVKIDPNIISEKVYNKAVAYVSADLFLGFEQMESKFTYLRGKSRYSSGKH